MPQRHQSSKQSFLSVLPAFSQKRASFTPFLARKSLILAIFATFRGCRCQNRDLGPLLQTKSGKGAKMCHFDHFLTIFDRFDRNQPKTRWFLTTFAGNVRKSLKISKNVIFGTLGVVCQVVVGGVTNGVQIHPQEGVKTPKKGYFGPLGVVWQAILTGRRPSQKPKLLLQTLGPPASGVPWPGGVPMPGPDQWPVTVDKAGRGGYMAWCRVPGCHLAL